MNFPTGINSRNQSMEHNYVSKIL